MVYIKLHENIIPRGLFQIHLHYLLNYHRDEMFSHDVLKQIYHFDQNSSFGISKQELHS